MRNILRKSGDVRLGALLHKMKRSWGSDEAIVYALERIEAKCRKLVGLDKPAVANIQALSSENAPCESDLSDLSKFFPDDAHSELNVPGCDDEMDLPNMNPSKHDLDEELDLPFAGRSGHGFDDELDLPDGSIHSDTAPRAVRHDKFVLGANTKGFISRGKPINVQARVVIANAVERLKQAAPPHGGKKKADLQHVPTKALLAELCRRIPCSASVEKLKDRGLAEQLVGSLTCVPTETVSYIWKSFATQGRVDLDASEVLPHDCNEVAVLATLVDGDTSMLFVVRKILCNAVLGRPYSHIVMDFQHHALTGGQLPGKFMNRRTSRVIEFLGANAAASVCGNLLYSRLGGLGIPSDLEHFFDPVTIGRLFNAVRATLMLTGAVFSTPYCNDGSTAIFVGAPPEGADGRGFVKLEHLLLGLEAGPVNLTLLYLKSSLAVLMTDGQYASGEHSKHRPFETAKHLFARLGRRPLVAWDSFHRVNRAGGVAFKHEQCQRIFPC